MALMDMHDIFPLFSASKELLKAGGCFVFVTSHPAFSSNLPIVVAEAEDIDGENVIKYSLKISSYLESKVQKGAGAPNEPNPHNYYHRPLSVLLGEAFKAGFVLDALKETSYKIDEIENIKPNSWINLPQIPQVIAGRLLVK